MRVITVHIIGEGYDCIYAVDDESDAQLVKRILDRLLHGRREAEASTSNAAVEEPQK